MNSEIICEFQNPKTHTGETPTTTDFWNYQEMICSSTLETLIENSTTGASFYVEKVIDYGSILILTFLMLFVVFGILGFLINFIIPKRINFKR